MGSHRQLSAKTVAFTALLIAFSVILIGIGALVIERIKDVSPLLTLQPKPDPTFWDTLVANSILLVGVGVSTALAFLTYSVYRSAVEAIDLTRVQADFSRKQAESSRDQAAAAIEQLRESQLSRRPMLKLSLGKIRTTETQAETWGKPWSDLPIFQGCVVPVALANVGKGPAIDIRTETEFIHWRNVGLPVYRGFSIPSLIVRKDGNYNNNELLVTSDNILQIVEEGGTHNFDLTISSNSNHVTDKAGYVSADEWISNEYVEDIVSGNRQPFCTGVELTIRFRPLGSLKQLSGNDNPTAWICLIVNILLSMAEDNSISAELFTVKLHDPLLDIEIALENTSACIYDNPEQVTKFGKELYVSSSVYDKFFGNFAGIEEELRVNRHIDSLSYRDQLPPVSFKSQEDAFAYAAANDDDAMRMCNPNKRLMNMKWLSNVGRFEYDGDFNETRRNWQL